MSEFFSKFFGKKEEPSSSPAISEGPPETSLRDAVTGLYNRKHLLQRLGANIARCGRSKERMAMVLWDIDGFVDFNNRFGQEKGDRFLNQVADIIRGCLRSYDEAFRSGGDEFCVILVPADDAVAKDVMDRVSRAVAKGLFQGDAEYADRQFSISAGLVFYPGENQVPEALLHEAGQSLYRNRKATAQ